MKKINRFIFDKKSLPWQTLSFHSKELLQSSLRMECASLQSIIIQ